MAHAHLHAGAASVLQVYSLLIVTVLLASTSCAEASGKELVKNSTTLHRVLPQGCSGTADSEAATALFRLNNATLEQHLRSVATKQREIIFTSVSLPAWPPLDIEMAQSFMWHMHHVGRAANVMFISQHTETCRRLVVRLSADARTFSLSA